MLIKTNNLPLIIDHDGAVDDIIAILIQLLYAPEQIKAITIVPADCYAKPTAWIMMQLKKMFLSSNIDIPIGMGTDEGPQPFPSKWRDHSWQLARIPLWHSEENLNNFNLNEIPNAIDLLTQTLQTTNSPLNILITGPCTNIAELLHSNPELNKKINRLFIMGGAFQVNGNVEENGHDGTAEWNIYNNPQAFLTVLRSRIPITLVPLDATQHAIIRDEFFTHLEQNKQVQACQLVYEGLLIIKPFIKTEEYQLWDTLTSVAIMNPDLIKIKKLTINVQLDGPSMGRTFEDPHGFAIDVALSADQELFETIVLKILTGKNL